MRRFWVCAAMIAMLISIGGAQQAPAGQPYKVIKTAKVGGASAG